MSGRKERGREWKGLDGRGKGRKGKRRKGKGRKGKERGKGKGKEKRKGRDGKRWERGRNYRKPIFISNFEVWGLSSCPIPVWVKFGMQVLAHNVLFQAKFHHDRRVLLYITVQNHHPNMTDFGTFGALPYPHPKVK